MDSRNITEEPIETKDFLETMYGLQKELLGNYIGIEGLPSYPVNVNTKANQTLLKDFSSRVCEELMEAYEAMRYVEDLMKKQQRFYHLISGFEKNIPKAIDDFNLMVAHLQNVGEELADATHFMLELLIYSNIQPIDIINYLENKLSTDILVELTDNSSEPLTTCIELGHKIYSSNPGFDTLLGDSSNTNIIKLYHELQENYGKEKIPEIEENFIKVGQEFSFEAYYFTQNLIFEVIYHLNIARNFLKNKPWKQSQMITDEVAFQGELVEAFVALCTLWSYLGATPELVYWLYFKKNRVNMFRIKSKY